MSLKEKYEAICNEYYRAFCEKHSFNYLVEEWLNDEPGILAEIDNRMITFSEIKYDIDNSISKELFMDWLLLSETIVSLDLPKSISFKSFCEGKPIPYSKEELAKARKAHEALTNAKLEYNKLIRNLGR